MFKHLSKLYRIWRLSKLKPTHVKYDTNDNVIRVKKATVSLVVRCEFNSELEGDTTNNIVCLSGDPLVLENDVVEAIITALWHTVAGTGEDGKEVTFSQVSVRVDPTFFKIYKVEVIPLKRSIFF